MIEHHVGGTNKMISKTPRTDAQPVVFAKLGCLVKRGFARQLERQLAAANKRIARLEKAGDAMAEYLACGVDVDNWRKAKEAQP